MSNIIIPEEFKQRLKELYKENSVIFVTGHAGMGKTCVVQEYLKNKKIAYTYLSADQMDFKEILQQQKNGLFVIDDFHNILSENETYLKDHFYELLRSHRFFLLSRAHMPSWLKVYRMIGQVGCVDGSALQFSEQDTREYLKMNQIDTDDTKVYQIMQGTKGYPLAIACLVFRLKTGITDNKKLKEKALQDVFDYYDEAVAHIWSRELYLFLIQMGGFESFSLHLASMVSGYHDVQQLIKEANKTGSFLELHEEKYVITPFFRKYLSYKQKQELSQNAINNIYYNAGLYYELQSDIKNALKYYSSCGNDDKICDLLIRNSNQHPGIAQYLEVEEYYRAFPKEKILENPDLICGMCMLCSLNIQPEESEYWYQELQEYCKKLKKIDNEYKYVKGKLYWLDISLPHRGSINVEKLIVKAATMKKNKEMTLQDISVTSNLPSALNGGKDFSIWVSRAEFIYSVMKPVMPVVLGKVGEGLPDICMAEKMLEQADENVYQLMNYINSGLYDAENKGKVETQFVAIALMYRVHMAQGNTDTAYQIIKEFKNQVEQKKHTQLLPNLNAVLTTYYLRTGKKEPVEIWMREEAPNENQKFNVFERYRYMVKARCYIATKKYMEGIALLNRLIQYGEGYDRTIIRIQARTLLAIILYRMKDDNWKEVLKEALSEAEKYQYISMIAEEGAAVLPLLQEIQIPLDKKYKDKLLQNVKKEAMTNPAYLKEESIDIDSLTSTEKQVLKLLGRGMKNKEIAEFLNVSLNTVAYHTKNIYQKLGVNNRTQATNIAKAIESE